MGNSINRKRPRGRPQTARYRVEPQYSGEYTFRMLSAPEIADYLQVTPQTAYKWIQAGTIPDDRRRLLAILALGELPWKGWSRFRVDPETGQLFTPAGTAFMPGEMAWSGFVKDHNRVLQGKIAELEQTVEELRAALDEVNSPNATKSEALAASLPFRFSAND